MRDEFNSLSAGFLLSIIGYPITRLFIDGLDVYGYIIVVSGGLAILFGVLFGKSAIIGVTLGEVINQLIILNVTVHSVIHVIFIFVLSIGAYLTYLQGVGNSISSKPTTVRASLRFILISLNTLIVGVAFYAWTCEIFGISNFHLTFLGIFTENVLAVLIISLLGGIIVGKTDFSTPKARSYTIESVDLWHWVLIIAPSFWALFGIVGSAGFTVRTGIPRTSFERRGVGYLYDLVHPSIFGQGGRRAQVALGALMLLLLFISITRFQEQKYG